MDNIPRVQVSSTVKWKNPFANRGGEGFVLRHNSLAPSSGRVLPVKEPTLRSVAGGGNERFYWGTIGTWRLKWGQDQDRLDLDYDNNAWVYRWMEHESERERHDTRKRGVCEDGRRSGRVRGTERDRKPPGTSLGTGAMSHLSYYSHSPRPDLRQTNNLSPTAATVATSLLPFSVLLSTIPPPPSLFHLALMGFVLVACACIYICMYIQHPPPQAPNRSLLQRHEPRVPAIYVNVN